MLKSSKLTWGSCLSALSTLKYSALCRFVIDTTIEGGNLSAFVLGSYTLEL